MKAVAFQLTIASASPMRKKVRKIGNVLKSIGYTPSGFEILSYFSSAKCLGSRSNDHRNATPIMSRKAIVVNNGP